MGKEGEGERKGGEGWESKEGGEEREGEKWEVSLPQQFSKVCMRWPALAKDWPGALIKYGTTVHLLFTVTFFHFMLAHKYVSVPYLFLLTLRRNFVCHYVYM